MKLESSHPLSAVLTDVKFVIEASPFEMSALWREYRDRLNWKFEDGSYFIDLGTTDGCAVEIKVTTAILNGIRVLFYTGTSAVIDHRKMAAWLNLNTSSRAELLDIDTTRFTANNFNECAQRIAKESGIVLAPAQNEYLDQASAYVDDNRELWRLIDNCYKFDRQGDTNETSRAYVALRRYLIAMLVAASKTHPAGVIPIGYLWKAAVDTVGIRECDGDTLLDIDGTEALAQVVRAVLKTGETYEKK